LERLSADVCELVTELESENLMKGKSIQLFVYYILVLTLEDIYKMLTCIQFSLALSLISLATDHESFDRFHPDFRVFYKQSANLPERKRMFKFN